MVTVKRGYCSLLIAELKSKTFHTHLKHKRPKLTKLTLAKDLKYIPQNWGQAIYKACNVKFRKISVVLYYYGEKNKLHLLECAVFCIPVPFCSDLG